MLQIFGHHVYTKNSSKLFSLIWIVGCNSEDNFFSSLNLQWRDDGEAILNPHDNFRFLGLSCVITVDRDIISSEPAKVSFDLYRIRVAYCSPSE